MTAEAFFNVPVLTDAVDAEEFPDDQTPALRVEAVSLTRHEPRAGGADGVAARAAAGVADGVADRAAAGATAGIASEIVPKTAHGHASVDDEHALRGTDGTIDREMLIAELQTEIAAHTYTLTDKILRSAFAEMEASIFAQISGRLRRELPEMIDELLRERLGDDTGY
jgi:hypothetical protein